MEQVFHQGETAVQQLAGEYQRAQMVGRAIHSSLYGGASHFIEKQPMAFIGSTDSHGHVWLSLVVGDFGFVKVDHPTEISLDESRIHSSKEDIFFSNIREEKNVGLLFIEPGTRRRFRVNGQVEWKDHEIVIQIGEAYGNCPKYIQRRVFSLPEQSLIVKSKTIEGNQLGASEKSWIQKADTFYVATRGLNGKTDASHRGGNQGFVEVLFDGTLRIPDYPGNSMFNTLGNIYENPNAGLLFVDFEKGATLQLTGEAELNFEQSSKDDLQKTGDTGRFWLFKTKKWIQTQNHHLLDWKLIDYSPFNP